LIELALGDVLPWLRSRLASAMKPLQREWERLRRDARRALDEMRDACDRIREEGEKCVSDRDHRKHRPGRAALRFHKVMSGVLASVSMPEGLSTEAIADLQRNLARVYNAVGKEWSGLLRQMEPYMIRARMKLKGAWRKLGDIVRELDGLAARCRPLELEDEVSAQVGRVERTKSQLEEVEAELGALSVEKREAEQSLAELLRAKEALENSEAIRRFREAEEAVEHLSMQVRSELRHAWKGLVKLRSSSEAGVLSLGPGEAETLAAYISNPARALAEEEDGYPRLLGLLARLEEAIERGSVRLKAKKVEKFRAWLEKARSGGLSELQTRCRKAIGELDALRSSEEVLEALGRLEELEQQISELRKKAEMLTGRINSLQAKRERLRKRLAEELSALEALLTDVTGEEVRVSVEKGG